MLSVFVTRIFDFLVPPRQSERLVRKLTLKELQNLGGEGGLPYNDPRVQALVWELKYYGSGRSAGLAGAYFGEQLLALAAEELGKPLLVPVPMHKARQIERGRNQTEVLCEAALFALSKVMGQENIFQYAPQALERVVDTKTQQGLPRRERLNNVKNSMRANPGLVEGRVCVVVDDVTTTGATLAEAKRALKLAGARAVHTIALAQS
jgi:ComF family protein